MREGDSRNSEKAAQRYFADDGRPLISVTQALVLSHVTDASHYPDDPRARIIGSAVHEVTAFLDLHNYHWDAVSQTVREPWDLIDPGIGDYVRAWEAFKRRSNFRISIFHKPANARPRQSAENYEAIELRLRPRIGQIQYGMTLDRVGLLGGKPVIVDLKCSRQDEPWWGVQLAGYELGMLAEYGPPKTRPYKWTRYGVRLMPDATGEPYRLELFDDPADYDVFRAALTVAIWRRNKYGIEI
jgi:hypothetical protein